MSGTYRGTIPAHTDGRRPAPRASRNRGLLAALAVEGVRALSRFVLSLLTGCTHRRKSFPYTPVRRNAAPGAVLNRTYVVCLDCGKTFDYDWNQMCLGPPATARPPTDAEPIRGRASVQPRIPSINIPPAPPRVVPPAPPRAVPHRYEPATPSRVRSLTA